MADNKATLALMRSLKTRLRAPSSPNVDEARALSQRTIRKHTHATSWADVAKQGLEERAAQPDESSEKALDLPDERRPRKGAPIRRLLGFLIRTVLRAWMRKLHGDDK